MRQRIRVVRKGIVLLSILGAELGPSPRAIASPVASEVELVGTFPNGAGGTYSVFAPTGYGTLDPQMIAQLNPTQTSVNGNQVNPSLANPPDVPLPPPTTTLPAAPGLIPYAPDLPPGVLPSPIPEPGAIALFGATLTWLAVRSQRARQRHQEQRVR